MSKHTPGPWKVESYLEPYNSHLLTYQVRSEFFVIAKCGTGYEAKENALLIAAAPELLEALQELKEELFRHAEGNYFRPFLDKAEDAIAKARGETE